MGRPINKRFIGNTGATGQQIAATAWLPGQGAPYTDAYITKQTGTGRYIMRANAGVASGQVSLVNGALTAAGQANITVTPYGGGAVEYAAVIFDNTVRTFTNNRTYDWKFEGISLTAAGQATIQSD